MLSLHPNNLCNDLSFIAKYANHLFFFFNFVLAVVFHSLSCVQLFANPWTAALQASLSFSVSWSLLKLMPFESVMPSNRLILCHPLPSCSQSFPASGSFPMSQLVTSGGQSIKASASASVLSTNIQD